jgi:putative nucleotidyltransferase with HDIG domain
MTTHPVSPYARILDAPTILRSLVLVSLFGSLAISIAFYVGGGDPITSYSLLIITAISICLLFLIRSGYYQISALILYLVVSFIITFNISIGHAIYDEGMITFPLLIIFAGLIFGKSSVVVVTAITLGELSLVYILADTGYIQPFEGVIQVGLEETITTLTILVATGLLTWVVVDIIEHAISKILNSEQDLEDAYDLTLAAWAKALELRKKEQPGHSGRVTSLSTLLAEKMDLDENAIQNIRQGALLHDIGKMGIPESILLKTKSLDNDEKELLKQHTQMANNIIEEIDYLRGALEIINCHHERYDGSGYPVGLSGDSIPINAQIFAIVDCWDSLSCDRPCRQAWTDKKILEYIQSQSGKKFHPEIVSAFVEFINGLENKEGE